MLEKVGKNFKVICHIATGGYGSIYQGVNTKTNLEVAIKTQPVDSETHNLMNECKLYHLLNKDGTVMDKGIPNVYYYSTQGDYNVLVMDLMGDSIYSLLSYSLGQFSLKTVLMLMDQMIVRLQFLHSHGYIHRDVKPDNFCLGLGKTTHKVYMIDLGLSARYVSNGKHISKGQHYFVGTCIYGSINNHLGVTQSRRDDMQSLGYSAMLFLRGNLPWAGIKRANKQQKVELIKKKKENTSIETLCKGHPQEFVRYLTMCRNLGFDQKPPYQEMRKMFKELFERLGYKRDFRYDWVVMDEKRQAAEQKRRGKQSKQEEQQL